VRIAAVVLGGLALAAFLSTNAAGRPDGAASGQLLSVTVSPVRPYRPGDDVWLTTPPTASGVGTLANGCERVPLTGYIGFNVYADSSAQYANYWAWSDSSSAQPFYWYLKRTNNTNADYGYSTGAGGSRTLAANIYYFKVQNKGSAPQAWNVCYEVR
jgi:hypothetical protein